MKKLVITDWNTLSMTDDLSTAALQELADVTAYPLTAPEEAAARIGDAELLLCNKTPITAAVLDACPNLEYIGVMATGYNNIDLKAAVQHGITVCNAGSYSTMAVAQHTFALMLHHFSRIAAYDRAVRAGAWEKSLQFSWFPYPTAELAGKTLCVVGYGSIGKAVAKLGKFRNAGKNYHKNNSNRLPVPSGFYGRGISNRRCPDDSYTIDPRNTASCQCGTAGKYETDCIPHQHSTGRHCRRNRIGRSIAKWCHCRSGSGCSGH